MLKFSAIALSLVLTSRVFAAESAGTDSDSLDPALATVNSTGEDLNFNDNVLLESSGMATQVRAVNSNGDFTFASKNITINGDNKTLNGGNANVRGFFIGGDGATLDGGSVTINELIFQGCKVQGGGSFSGGGGMGAGGGLFVYKNTSVTIKDCTFSNCSATGGSSSLGGAGGGGMKGNGGTAEDGGGGGFGGEGDKGGGGCSDFPEGDAMGNTPGNNFDDSGAAGSSGVGGTGTTGQNGGFGGGGGFGSAVKGGDGGFGGGGGLGISGNDGGDGGFGGGGGAATAEGTADGGDGGFGAGGGIGKLGVEGMGGFGGGDADSSIPEGGAGAGFGGAIFVMDGAELTIEGSISFSNNDVAAGTGLNPDAAGNGALGKDIFMMSTSLVTFDITSDVILQNPIEGNQGSEGEDTSKKGLTKKGPARLLLTGDNTFTGTTTVEEGELRINSSVVTDVVVEPGAILSGNFDVKLDATGTNGGNLTNKGIVCPGVSGVGQINLEGDFVQESTGTLIVDITPTGNVNDKVFLTMGSATLAGTMNVIVNPGNYIAGTTYEVINATTNGTEFETVLETGAFGKLIDLRVDYSSVVITILDTVLFEGQKIDSGPPSDVVKCIRAADIVPFSDFAIVVESLGLLNDREVNKALTSLSAVNFGALEWANARNNSYEADILSQHLYELCCSPRDCCSCDCNTSGWISVFGNWMNNRKRLDFLGRNSADAVGVLVGIDSCCSPCFIYGAAFGYTRTCFIWKGNLGEGDTDSYYGALYGSWDTGCYFITDFSVLGGGTFNDMERHIEYAAIRRDAKSDFWSYFVTAHLGFRSNWQWCCSTFEPFALVDYHYYTHEKFKEHGADSLNLSVKSKDQHIMRGEAGLKWYYERECDCSCYAPYFGLSWVGEFPLNKSKQPASFTGQSCVIDATSYDSSVQLASPQAGVKWTHCNGASVLLGYKGLFNNRVRINEAEIRFEWIF